MVEPEPDLCTDSGSDQKVHRLWLRNTAATYKEEEQERTENHFIFIDNCLLYIYTNIGIGIGIYIFLPEYIQLHEFFIDRTV